MPDDAGTRFYLVFKFPTEAIGGRLKIRRGDGETCEEVCRYARSASSEHPGAIALGDCATTVARLHPPHGRS